MTHKRKYSNLFDDEECENFFISIDKKQKSLQFTGDISPKSVHIFKENIKDILNSFRVNQEKIISIEIQSDGGDLFSGCGCYDWLMKFKNDNDIKINTFAMGLVASAATLIFMAGDNRQMGRNSYLLIHNISISNQTTQHFNVIRQNFENDKNLSSNLLNFYKKHCKIPHNILSDMMDKDIYLTYEICSKYEITTK